MEAEDSRMRSGIQTGSMGVLESALMIRAFSLPAVSTFARLQQNMDFPQPGFPQTVMILDIYVPSLIPLPCLLYCFHPQPSVHLQLLCRHPDLQFQKAPLLHTWKAPELPLPFRPHKG